MPTRVIAYTRVSSDQQAKEGISLDAQRQKLEAYCLALDLELVAVIEDAGFSAKSLDRPGLRGALKLLDEGKADAILVAKLDRLTRSVKDLGYLVEKYFSSKFSLLSVADSIDTRSAAGRLVLNVLASVSQWEREAIGERTRDALSYLKANGTKLGRVGYGYKREQSMDDSGRRRIAIDEKELAIVERIHELKSKGMNLREIASALNRQGVPAPRGGQWAPETVRRILLRPPHSIARVEVLPEPGSVSTSS